MRWMAVRWIVLGLRGRAMNLNRTTSAASLISTTPCIFSGASSSRLKAGSSIMSRPIFLVVRRSSSTSVPRANARLNFTVVQSRLKLVMWPTWPNGTMWSWPFWCRSLSERTLKPSTVPLTLLQSTYSPMRKESSARKNMPDTMSFTSDWLPNETARPSTEAPAISGVMLTPSSDSTSRPPTTTMTTPAMARSSGIRVRSREAATLTSSSASPATSADGNGLAAI